MKWLRRFAALVALSAVTWSTILLAPLASAQSAKSAPQTTKTHKPLSKTAKYCHDLFVAFSNDSVDVLRPWTDESLRQLRGELQDCAYNENLSLSKNDLVIAALVATWVATVFDERYSILELQANGSRQRIQELEKIIQPEPYQDPNMPKSGQATVYPLDLGHSYFAVEMGAKSMTCNATSAKTLSCREWANQNPLGLTGAVLAQQGHEYLIGCQQLGWGADDACAAIAPGSYAVIVHNRSVTITNSGLVVINTDTGKHLRDIVPVFAVLQKLK